MRRKRNSQRRKRERGFTLIEILVVLIIIGTIAALVSIRVIDRLEESRVRSASIQMQSLKQALDLFRLDNGFYPTTEQGLDSLVRIPEVGRIPENYRPAGYLNSTDVPLDPWGHSYQYISDGFAYQIWSMGADAKNGTEDDIPG